MVILEIPASELLSKIGKCFPRKTFITSIGRVNVKMSSDRLECFRRNHKCVECSKDGKLFRLEINKGTKTPHLNLYHQRSNGKLTLMTKDHIIPLSKGGEDNITNLQTMCTDCNSKKGDSFFVIGINNGFAEINKYLMSYGNTLHHLPTV